LEVSVSNKLGCAAVGVTVFLLLLPGLAGAHHSFAGFYDPDRIVEIEGVLTEISWRNPHGRLRMDVTDASGRVAEWSIETGSISILRVRGLEPTFAQVGDRVRIAGEASVRSATALYAQQMLLADGREVLLSSGIEPRWTAPETGELLEPVFDVRVASEARRKADGIFRVWSTVFEDPAAFPMFKGDYPLTERGKQLRAQWDPASVALNDCTQKAMPLLMITPLPLEFARDGEDIVIRFEEDDAVRRIHMGASTPPSAHSFLGYSTGRWENDTLVVETSHLQAALLDPDGVRQSAEIRVVERFMPAVNGERMDYRITITDPEIFTQPFDLTRYFIWRPELVVNEYDCAVRAPITR
jgi:hypothetical protein